MADIVAYWTFNDYANGTLLSATTDSSGNGYTVSNVGDANYRPFISSSNQLYGNHLQRNNATAESKSNSNITAANVYTGNMTISYWGTQPTTNWRNYITLRTDSTGDEFQFQKANNGMVVYKTDRNNGNATSMVGDASLSLGTAWHHFVVTVDSSTQKARMYIDGSLISETTWTYNEQVTNLTFNGAWNFGKRSSDANLDEVQIYNNSITAEQVSFLYNNPSLYLATGYQRDVTSDGNWSDSVWNANQLTDQAFANSSAVQLDAENSPTLTLNQNVTVNSLDFNGSMTIDGSNTITLNGEKRITVAGADDVVTISAPISPLYDNAFTKTGAGTLVFTEANAFTGNPTVSDGTLRLTDNAVTANGVITLEADETLGTKGTLEYNVASGEKTLIFSNAASVIGNGDILKTGEGRLKINTEGISNADLEFSVDNFVVSSGRVDIKGYMSGNLLVDAIDGPTAVFSPGNSVGEATFGGGFILNEAGTALLMEIGGEETNKNDSLIVGGDIELNNGLIYLELADDSTLKGGDTFTAILYGSNSGEDGFSENLLSHVSSYYFTNLDYIPLGGGVYAITGTVDPNAVPEPSTWALLALGVVVLFLRKRVRN